LCEFLRENFLVFTVCQNHLAFHLDPANFFSEPGPTFVNRAQITKIGAEPSGVDSGQISYRGYGAHSPLKLKNFKLLGATRKQQIRLILRILQSGEPYAPNVTGPLPTPLRSVKNHRICIDLGKNFWQKWGEHIHPSLYTVATRPCANIHPRFPKFLPRKNFVNSKALSRSVKTFSK